MVYERVLQYTCTYCNTRVVHVLQYCNYILTTVSSFAQLSRRSSWTAVCRQSECEKMMAAFLSKGGTPSDTIRRLLHETAAKQAIASIKKDAAAAGRIAVRAASRALLHADELQNGAGRQANAAAAANAAERAARHMPDRRAVVEEESDSGGGEESDSGGGEESDSGGGAPKKKKNKKNKKKNNTKKKKKKNTKKRKSGIRRS